MIDREFLKTIKPVYTLYNFYRYAVFQIKLRLANFQDRKSRHNPRYARIPPAKLRHRVHGTLDKESFITVGETLARNIRDLCAMVNRDIYSFEQVLDFGCGSGRVIRNFQNVTPPPRVPPVWH